MFSQRMRNRVKLLLLAVLVLVLATLACGESTPEPAAPSQSEGPTNTPGPLSYADIQQAKKDLTDLQWETYRQEIEGERIQFAGAVIEVYDDGRVQIDEGKGLISVCMLYEVPLDVAAKLNKDQFVQGEGTIREIDTTLGMAVWINVDSLVGEEIAEAPTEQPAETLEPMAEPEPTGMPVSTDTPEPKELYLGDVIEQDGMLLTALAVEDPATPGMFYEPEEGKKLVAVEIIVGNISGELVGINPLNTTLLDDEGFTYEAELAARDGQIATLDVNTGEKARGWVAFSIPEEATPASIKYTLGLFSSESLRASLIPPPDGYIPNTEALSILPPDLPTQLGETTEQYGYSLSATTVEDPATPGMFYESQPGHKLVAVEIVLGNVSGAEALSVNPLSTILVDDSGYVYDAELAGRDDQLATLDLGTGEKVKGWVAFVIPESATPASIKYTVNMFSGEFLQTAVE